MTVATRGKRGDDPGARSLERLLRTALVSILGFFVLYFLILFVLTR
ncbi:MAG: hypothetical protein ACE15B_08925 [Bryobacteraceae bacterium]